jgi:hypothetical protein
VGLSPAQVCDALDTISSSAHGRVGLNDLRLVNHAGCNMYGRYCVTDSGGMSADVFAVGTMLHLAIKLCVNRSGFGKD